MGSIAEKKSKNFDDKVDLRFKANCDDVCSIIIFIFDYRGLRIRE